MKNIEFDANLSFKSPIGWITLFAREEIIVQIEIIGSSNKGPCGNRVIPNFGKAKVLSQAQKEILDYLQGKTTALTFKFKFQGTEFQESVWKEVSKIRYGRTLTYTQIAERLNNPGAARAVGTAVGSNPLPILIPCHRVVASGNKLTGYFAGEGIETQQQFLDLERGTAKVIKK